MARNERLRAARLQRGLSQEKLARRTACRRYKIYKLEVGLAEVEVKLRRRIAKVLRKPAWLLFEG